ncbi:AAA family ATPase [Candidatus Laterigemmans baculatus]|uniref:AAA family ATPase n=1 Tax=Candidatus Laterigemmans baculatus TaxID=2770505 RepID=UPI0013DCB02E|nr:MoxR family ATPase [Candidatus Laterigemmans baculatus]
MAIEDDPQLRAELERFREDFARLREEVARVIVGQREIVDGVLMALVAGGHVLLEGVPGLGKTLLVRTLASVLEARFSRIQFTPDLMPADLIGTNVLVEGEGGQREFRFDPGPLFANVVLADEINRATPKTQSALLEAMQEHSVTVAGVTHSLDRLFFVLATQNPLEMEGTYPLPEAQLDRFLLKLIVPYPTAEEMETILDRTTDVDSPTASPLLKPERVLEMSRLARRIPVADEVRRFAIQTVMGTHPDQPQASPMVRQFVRYGASPRGAQAVLLTAKIHALLDDRYHVARDDIRAVARSALRHRVLLNFEGQAEAISTDAVVEDVMQHVGDAVLA